LTVVTPGAIAQFNDKSKQVTRTSRSVPSVVTPVAEQVTTIERTQQEVYGMTTTDQTLDRVAEIVRAELPKHFLFNAWCEL